MFDQFLFVGLPYAAILSLVVGSVARYKMRAFSYSSLSTQFLEDRWLAWASLPWHIGIFLVLAGHLLAFGLPGIWSALVSIPTFLLAVEVLGLFSALLCLLSLIILLVRRFVDARLRAVTSYIDVAVLLILLFQVSTGLAVAVHHRWGSAWAPGALGPYIHSIFLLQPDVSFVKEMPPFVKLHIASAWVLIMFLPFTRLVHALSVPLHYFVRSPQRVVWNNSRSQVRFKQKNPG
ncbi:MAG: respiratory nitrate reductase subunit gamma [Candidatus Omnitrophica bacterium]|nr:respiratory nitrate reductase subunit gamma [Candidatus Omnitrophota bacterium]